MRETGRHVAAVCCDRWVGAQQAPQQCRAAAVLPWRYTWLIAGASVAAYSILLYVYQPFPLFAPHVMPGHHGDSANSHVLGM